MEREEGTSSRSSPTSATSGPRAAPARCTTPSPSRTAPGTATGLPKTTDLLDEELDHQRYLDMMFGEGESFEDFSAKQSNGRFSPGDVSDWVTDAYNESRYGRDRPRRRHRRPRLLELRQGRRGRMVPTRPRRARASAESRATSPLTGRPLRLRRRRRLQRPDGYIDHFRRSTPVEGEEAGGSTGRGRHLSHRWYAYNTYDRRGPTPTSRAASARRHRLWIGDYTTEPENSRPRCVPPRFGHDLGLPDLYDTQVATTAPASGR